MNNNLVKFNLKQNIHITAKKFDITQIVNNHMIIMIAKRESGMIKSEYLKIKI